MLTDRNNGGIKEAKGARVVRSCPSSNLTSSLDARTKPLRKDRFVLSDIAKSPSRRNRKMHHNAFFSSARPSGFGTQYHRPLTLSRLIVNYNFKNNAQVAVFPYYTLYNFRDRHQNTHLCITTTIPINGKFSGAESGKKIYLIYRSAHNISFTARSHIVGFCLKNILTFLPASVMLGFAAENSKKKRTPHPTDSGFFAPIVSYGGVCVSAFADIRVTEQADSSFSVFSSPAIRCVGWASSEKGKRNHVTSIHQRRNLHVQRREKARVWQEAIITRAQGIRLRVNAHSATHRPIIQFTPAVAGGGLSALPQRRSFAEMEAL